MYFPLSRLAVSAAEFVTRFLEYSLRFLDLWPQLSFMLFSLYKEATAKGKK